MVELNVVGSNTSINRVNEKLKSFDDWSAITIDERQNILIDLSRYVWKIETL